MGALAAQRTLVDHTGLAFGFVVHDHRTMFDMLARIDEVNAEHVELAMLAAEILIHADAYHVATERDLRMTQRCLLAHMDAMVAHMLGATIPFLNEGRADVGVLAGDDLHAFGESGIAIVLDDDIGMDASVGCDDQMQGIQSVIGSEHLDQHGMLEILLEFDDCGFPGTVPFDAGDTVIRHTHGSAQVFAHVHRAHIDLGPVHCGAIDHRHAHLRSAAGFEHIEEFTEAVDGCESPILLLARGHWERLHLE